MSDIGRTSRRWLGRVVLGLASALLGLGLAELALRCLSTKEPRLGCYFRGQDRQVLDYAAAVAAGGIVPWEVPLRSRTTFAPGFSFYICYRGSRAAWLDEQGCVPVQINRIGIRDRDEIGWDKPPGQKRVVCLGDSFTFGWGVRGERVWTRLVENDIKQYGDWLCVNCGVSDGLYIDEYWRAFQDRFHRLGPDVVLVSICLNDVALIPNTIALHRTPLRLQLAGVDLRRISRLADALAGIYDRANVVSLPPGIDYGAALLAQTNLDPAALADYAGKSQDPGAVWPSGAPQRALRELHAWCVARRVELRIVLWPLLQGLATDEVYPFAALHAVVRDFCAAERIPLLDLLATFAGHDAERLWVDPCDEHPNELANAIAAPRIARFLIESQALQR